ncbi:MAG: hypothetical protein GY938_24540 [Ketobacter sp.]|nr:hypothetical protein [Ketobacter sp.]
MLSLENLKLSWEVTETAVGQYTLDIKLSAERGHISMPIDEINIPARGVISMEGSEKVQLLCIHRPPVAEISKARTPAEVISDLNDESDR